jgi:7-carboxy-7-deazaguanine synthase
MTKETGEKTVKLIECFNSFQGEGPDSGQAMMILRFKTCNLNCPWCDTSVKMRISMEAEYSLSAIQKEIDRARSGLLITGGEPTVPKHAKEALMLLNEIDYPIANVESNGFKLVELIQSTDPSKNVKFIYSPKIFHIGDVKEATTLTKTLFDISDKVYVKVVFDDNRVLDPYLTYLNHEIIGNRKDRFDRVWLMPEGTNRADLIKNSEIVFDACEKYRFNFSSRSHLIFGFI